MAKLQKPCLLSRSEALLAAQAFKRLQLFTVTPSKVTKKKSVCIIYSQGWMIKIGILAPGGVHSKSKDIFQLLENRKEKF